MEYATLAAVYRSVETTQADTEKTAASVAYSITCR